MIRYMAAIPFALILVVKPELTVARSFIDDYRSSAESSCLSSMTSGPDGIVEEIARPVCRCVAQELTSRYTEAELQAFDANPSLYMGPIEAISTDCSEKVLTGTFR